MDGCDGSGVVMGLKGGIGQVVQADGGIERIAGGLHAGFERRVVKFD